MLRVGDTLDGGWIVTVANPPFTVPGPHGWAKSKPAYFEAKLEIDGRLVCQMGATTKRGLRDRCASYLRDQAARKDGGVFGKASRGKVIDGLVGSKSEGH